MELTRDFNQLSKHDSPIAGGKGASLGEMTSVFAKATTDKQAHNLVPPGFVVLSAGFEKFLESTDLNVEIDSILHSVNQKEMHTVENASAKIKDLILKARMPKDIKEEIKKEFKKLNSQFVAVRSSATAEDSSSAAWAGQLDSFLNTTEETLLANVQKCWASLFTPRAIFYRFEKGLHNSKISVAVVIQKMIESEVSGIAFSVHPVTQDYNQLIIEAGYGLGEAIVSGQITPDSYVIEKNPRRIIDKNVSTQERGIYRKTKDGGNKWKTITPEKGQQQKLTDEQILELSELIIKIENHYGFPVDIEWAKEEGKFYITQSRPITTLGGEQDDLSRFTSTNTSLEHADGLPVYFEMTMAGFTDKLRNNHLSSYEIGISHFIKDEVDYISLVQDQNKIGSEIIKDFLNNPSNILDLYKEWMVGYKKMLDRFSVVFDYDLKKFSNKKLLSLSDDIYSFYRKEVSMPGFTDGFMFYAEKRLNDLIMEYCDINKLKNFIEIFTTLTASTEPSFFNEKESDLSHASDTESKNNLLKKYAWLNSSYSGYKPYTKENLESDLKELKDPALAKKQLSDNKLVKQDLINKHKFNDEILAIVKLTDLFIKWQDQRKVYTLSYVALRSEILHEIAQRFKLDIKLLEYALTEELPLVLDKSFSIDVLKNRRDSGVLFIHKNGKLQETIVGEAAESFVAKLQAPKNKGVSEISGTVASKGKAVGKVRIVMSAKNINRVENGEILVAPMTRPEHLIGMKKAAAIVTDDGGITCHAAIVSRELGIPCIIGTKIATKVLRDGDLVEVDADKGVVRILERAEEKNGNGQSRPITTLDEKKYNKEKEIIFDKFISRAYSMLQIEAYNGFLTEVSKEIGHPATYPIFVYDFTQELVHLYYNMKELKLFIDKVGEKISNEDGFRKNIFSKSMEVFESIKKYFDGELSVKTIEELRSFWKLFKDYMKYVSYVWVLPGLDFVPQKIRDEAMDIRKKTEYYAGRRDSIMNEFVASMIDNRLVNPSFLSLEEIKNNGDFERITKERSKGFLFYRGEIVSVAKISYFLRSKNFILREPEITDNSKIKGEIAQKGFVKGIARIVYTEKDLTKISSSNDILVSPMTRPEFVPAMKIAGAVITDEGGIVCHAAIVAREMKKPCVIGTKIATKVLHDGDLVEVDADNGVVRIIKRAKEK